MAIATRKMQDYELSLGHAKRAVKYTRRAVGKCHHKTLDVMHTLAGSLYALGRYTEAIDTLQKVHTRALQNSGGSETIWSAKIMNDMCHMTPKPGSPEWDSNFLIKHLTYANIGIAAYRSINQVCYAPTTLVASIFLYPTQYSNYKSCTGIGTRERNREPQAALGKHCAKHQQLPD